MAAIDYFGNMIRVTAAGTVTYDFVDIVSMVIWSANTTSNLVMGLSDSSGSEILNFISNSQIPSTTPLGDFGRHQKVTFNTVTACTAYLFLR